MIKPNQCEIAPNLAAKKDLPNECSSASAKESEKATSKASEGPKNGGTQTAKERAAETRRLERAADKKNGITRLDWRVWASHVPALRNYAEKKGFIPPDGRLRKPVSLIDGKPPVDAASAPKQPPEPSTGRHEPVNEAGPNLSVGSQNRPVDAVTPQPETETKQSEMNF